MEAIDHESAPYLFDSRPDLRDREVFFAESFIACLENYSQLQNQSTPAGDEAT